MAPTVNPIEDKIIEKECEYKNQDVIWQMKYGPIFIHKKKACKDDYFGKNTSQLTTHSYAQISNRVLPVIKRFFFEMTENDFEYNEYNEQWNE